MYQILKERKILTLKGPDSKKFLNSLITNQITDQKLFYTYFLNNQGRYLYDSFVYAQGEEIYLDVDEAISASLLKYLTFRRLRSNFDITLRDHVTILYSQEEPKNEIEAIFLQQDPRHPQMGYRIAVTNDKVANLNLAQGSLYQEDCYKYCVIEGCRDLIYEKSIPIEYNAEEQNAISFTKGCYIGQEVMSRAKYQGVIRKKVFLLETEAQPEPAMNQVLAAQTPVLDEEGKKIGILCSCFGKSAFALLYKDKLPSNQQVIIDQIRFKIISSL